MWKKAATFLLTFCVFAMAMAQGPEDADFSATADTTKNAAADSSTIIASLLVTSPDRTAWGVCGHAALRLQSPENDLDWVFSYEVPKPENQLYLFLSGTLQETLVAVPTAAYMEPCRQKDRTLTEYILNLPHPTKQRLWMIVDKQLERGIERPYDYINHGCAREVIYLVEQALTTGAIQYADLPQELQCSRRDIFRHSISQSKWWRSLWSFVFGETDDRHLSTEDRLMIPAHLAQAWSQAQVADSTGHLQPLMTGETNVLVKGNYQPRNGWLTPELVFTLLLIIVAVITAMDIRALRSLGSLKSLGSLGAGKRLGSGLIDVVLLALQTLPGLFLTYLLFFSRLVATDWNWLYIIFNPLPLLLLCIDWRKHFTHTTWAKIYLCYAVILTLFIVGGIALSALTSVIQTIQPIEYLMALAFLMRCIYKCGLHRSLHDIQNTKNTQNINKRNPKQTN